MAGYIKLFRKFVDWEWYNDANTMRLFLHCLLNANYVDKKWRGIVIKRGSFLTGRYKLAQELNISEMQVRTALKKLKITNEIAIKTTPEYSIITVVNWDSYQGDNQQDNQQNNQEITSKITKSQPLHNNGLEGSNNQQNNQQITNGITNGITTTKNKRIEEYTYNPLINDNYNKSYISDLEKSHSSEPKKNVIAFKKPSLDEVKQYCIENKKNVDAVSFWNFYEAKDWMIGKNKMKYWKAAIATWEKRNKPANAVSVPYYSDQIED